MKPPKLRIFASPADNGACGNYRVVQPLDALAATLDYSVGYLEGSFVDEAETMEFMSESDVFVFQRPRSSKQVAFFETFKQDPRKLLVFEHDDNTWDLHPLSDHFRWHGLTDIAIPKEQYPGSIADAKREGKTVKDGMVWLWEHGVNGYDVRENRQKRENFETCLSLADVITCTTPELAKLFRKKAKELGNPKPKVYALPNCFDLRKWLPVEIKHEGIRILWQGGASHQPDLKIIQEALEIICKKFPEVTLIMGGVNFPGITKNIPSKQVEVYDNWTEYSAHPYRMALFAADINLVPIEDTYFNGFKSDIKVTEAGALKVPSVASNLTPYKESIEHNKTGLLAQNTTASWVKQVSRLVESERLRKTIGANARRWVEENRDITKEAHRWAKVYESELKRKRKWSHQPSSIKSKGSSTTPKDKSTPPLLSRQRSSSSPQG